MFKNGPSKLCGRQPLKNFKGCGLLKADHAPSNFLKAVFQKFTFSILEYFASNGRKVNMDKNSSRNCEKNAINI